MREISYDELNGIKKFKEGLEECFNNYLKDNSDATSQIIINYVLKVIDIQYTFVEKEFDGWADKMARHYERN